MTKIEQEFLEALRTVLGEPSEMIPLHAPEFSGREWELVKDCLDSTFVSSVGKYVDSFERMLAEFTGAKYAIAVANGTAALHVAMYLAGVKPGDEVLIPSLSFVATANAVSHCGAIPHFVDSDRENLGLDPERLREHLKNIGEFSSQGVINRQTKRRIAAIVPMHTYGHAVEMDQLLAFSKDFSLPIVEDAAEGLGSYYKGRHVGSFGLLGTLSFNGNKIVTTGGGGAILTNDDALGKLAKHITTTAKKPHRWAFFHDHVAWNYRLPNLNAALGCAQLEQLPSFLSRKRKLAQKYIEAFASCSELEFISEPRETISNYWLNTVRLKHSNMEERDRLLDLLNDKGYQCRPTWTLLHRLPMYNDCPKADLTVAEELEQQLINIPSSAVLGA